VSPRESKCTRAAKWTVARHPSLTKIYLVECSIHCRDSHEEMLKMLVGFVAPSFSLARAIPFSIPLLPSGGTDRSPSPSSPPPLRETVNAAREIAVAFPLIPLGQRAIRAENARGRIRGSSRRSSVVAVLRTFARIIPARRSPQARAQLADQTPRFSLNNKLSSCFPAARVEAYGVITVAGV